MIDVVNKRCNFEGCMKLPSFNYKFKSPEYCHEHKSENMINLRYQTCAVETCNIMAKYNYPNNSRGMYCTTHKKHNMINIHSTKCQTTGCKKQPYIDTFGMLSKFCEEHDIEKKPLRCAKCSNIAVYGSIGLFPRHCFMHRLPIDIKLKK